MTAGILIGLFFTAYLLYFSIRFTYSIISFNSPLWLRNFLNRHFILRKLKDRYSTLVHQYPFYQGLSIRDKKYFEKRVQRFIDSKEFIHRVQGHKVTDEMKVMIAATAIQLTFYHPSIYLDHFWRILIYNSNYFSTITKQYHQGEVNARGYIVLSWDNFMRGVDDSSDGIHLGFHEMAHALQVENIIENNEFDFLDKKLLSEFKQVAEKEILAIKGGQQEFFRKSAYFNIHEFFAVVVESFFERPDELRNHSKHLYNLTAGILRYPEK